MRKSILFLMMMVSVLSVSAFASDPSDELGQLIPADEIESTQMVEDARLGFPGPQSLIPDDATCRDPIRVWWFRCFANNASGLLFAAIGREPQETQDRAMHRCFLFPSNLCRPLGCRIEY